MKSSTKNLMKAKVKSVQRGDFMSLVKFNVPSPVEMTSFLDVNSAEHLDLKVGDEVELVVKACLIRQRDRRGSIPEPFL